MTFENWRVSVTSIGVLGALFAAGCGGPDCVEVCEGVQDCEGVEAGDCEAGCEELETLGEDSGCSGEIEDYLECWEGAEDVCEPRECIGEAFAFLGCSLEYCEDNPDADGCDSTSGTGSSGCDFTYSSGSAPTCSVNASCNEQDFALSCNEEQCTCSVDGDDIATVPYEASFCEGELDSQVDAADQACGWPD